ncbi:MAG: hypothetical protein WD118_07770 [Phycisphaeraceae bacterium]
MKISLWTLAVMGAFSLGGWSLAHAAEGGDQDLPPCYPCCRACE